MTGVLQGSLLCPLLFKIYSKDTFYIIERTDIYNFADDKPLTLVATMIVHYCLILVEWFCNTLMTLKAEILRVDVCQSKGYNSLGRTFCKTFRHTH